MVNSLQPRTVLVADDEPDILEVIQFNLELMGLHCIATNNGEDALVHAREARPDVIILDVMMPKMNGYQVARELKADATCSRIPIIMLTARAQESDVEQGKQAGADRYVTKPFEIDDLMAVVQGFIDAGTQRTV
jgi:CheY-like chemotaxis protein